MTLLSRQCSLAVAAPGCATPLRALELAAFLAGRQPRLASRRARVSDCCLDSVSAGCATASPLWFRTVTGSPEPRRRAGQGDRRSGMPAATSMNADGGSRPWVGCSHRTSASIPTSAPVSRSTTGW